MSDTTKELLDAAWGVIANVSGGNWTKQDAEWRERAERWRDQYTAAPSGTTVSKGGTVLTIRDCDTGETSFDVVDVPEGFSIQMSLPTGLDPLTAFISTIVSPADAVALVAFIQTKLGQVEGITDARLTMGPWIQCTTCKMWIHKHSPIKHNCAGQPRLGQPNA